MPQPIHLAISTCPNDTFAFHALLEGKIDTHGIDFKIELFDVQELNDGLFEGRFDVAKASFHAALLLSDRVKVFDSGSALGFGVGPLLLASRSDVVSQVTKNRTSSTSQTGLKVFCPGAHTTATLLCRLFYPELKEIKQVVFSDIMPALHSGGADLGVCIHEGRFTWQEQGLHFVADLGERWEQATECPLPLGGIVGRSTLDSSLLRQIQSIIRDSIEYGLANRDETVPTMKKYAQEFDEGVLFAHVDLYVNQWTQSLGEVGEKALSQLHQMAVGIGLIPSQQRPLKRIVS